MPTFSSQLRLEEIKVDSLSSTLLQTCSNSILALIQGQVPTRTSTGEARQQDCHVAHHETDLLVQARI